MHLIIVLACALFWSFCWYKIAQRVGYKRPHEAFWSPVFPFNLAGLGRPFIYGCFAIIASGAVFMAQLGALAYVFSLLVGVTLLSAVSTLKIMKKLGYGGGMAVVSYIPIFNFLSVLFLAFGPLGSEMQFSSEKTVIVDQNLVEMIKNCMIQGMKEEQILAFAQEAGIGVVEFKRALYEAKKA